MGLIHGKHSHTQLLHPPPTPTHTYRSHTHNYKTPATRLQRLSVSKTPAVDAPSLVKTPAVDGPSLVKTPAVDRYYL